MHRGRQFRAPQRFEHEAGPLEFGRGPQRQARRCLIDGDPTASRDQLRIELLADGRVRLENLSQRNPVVMPDFCRIAELRLDGGRPAGGRCSPDKLRSPSGRKPPPNRLPRTRTVKMVEGLRLQATWTGQEVAD